MNSIIMKQKYIAYYRVSTARQGESGLGLESQKAIIKYFLRDKEILSEFTEIASGKTAIDRPILQEAIDFCIKNDAQLVVAKADRLSRNVLDALGIYEKLNGRLICCDIPNTDKFTLTIFFAIAERERELISIRTKSALNAKKERLKLTGGKLGNPRIRDLVQNENRLNKLRLSKNDTSRKNSKHFFELIKLLRKEGRSYKKIADFLNESKYKTSKNCRFYAMSIRRALYNYINQ